VDSRPVGRALQIGARHRDDLRIEGISAPGALMIESVEIKDPVALDEYCAKVDLSATVQSMREVATSLLRRLRGRKVWMVNSTANGGGVAEMLPQLVTILCELGLPTEWVVMGSNEPEFFVLTKRLHNMIHGQGNGQLGERERALYEAVSRENARDLKGRIGPRDILVIHDPQPLGMGALLKQELDIPMIFRCHIGLDEDLPATRSAWEFLKPFASAYDYAVFSAPEYIPDFLAGRSGIIHPALDPLSYKNRDLSPQQLTGILCNARLLPTHHPVVPLTFPDSAKRLRGDGTFAPADCDGGIGLLFRPIISQVSRWDRLKGFKPLLDAFVTLKRLRPRNSDEFSDRHRHRLGILRLVLAGPDPEAVADDPEGQEVLAELIDAYRALPGSLQDDIALISLPMASRRDNALMVNALQRCSTVIVQNSLREGFGLTVTEGMWKALGMIGSRACGIRQQIRNGIEGRLIDDPEDSDEIAETLNEMLEDVPARNRMSQNARRRVHEDFLIFTQVRRWLEVLAEQVDC
jgi:trehalose synthase